MVDYVNKYFFFPEMQMEGVTIFTTTAKNPTDSINTSKPERNREATHIVVALSKSLQTVQ